MQILIEIDEEIYNYMQTEEYDEHLDKRFEYQIRFAIKYGIPLPKEHGRLIDETKAMCLIAEGKEGNKAYFGTLNKDWEVIDFLKTVPTIIQAYKGVKNESNL